MLEWDHLKKAEANWFKHWYLAMYYSGIALLVAIFGIIHAFSKEDYRWCRNKLSSMCS
jgi:uncharacterized iron-regulated membrane protein